MKAIAYLEAGPIQGGPDLIEVQLDAPQPGPRDLFVEVRAISVNPVDTKVREMVSPEGAPKVLGFDAAGVVALVGSEVTLFQPGDEVFYAGDITRPGTNSEIHLVDERIAGRRPASLTFAQSAAMPLTTITAWEILFDSFCLSEGDGAGESLLVIGGAGGVGSILIQLAKKLTGLEVIATASRPETREWVEKMGADRVIDHRNSLDDELKALGIAPKYVASLTHTESHLAAIVNLIQPRGHIAVIDDPKTLDVVPMKLKALSLSWEFMFARSMYQTADMVEQHELLCRAADLFDEGILITTMNAHAGPMSTVNLQRAHEMQDSGGTIGKIVLDGFDD